ncbi:hypothetical protein [Actinomadura yumaensis]|uniref:Minor tail protein n=1 Tax=Actinomadura yumaensis TaxID=111807 RepID=A0ABW2CSR8_9ACTN
MKVVPRPTPDKWVRVTAGVGYVYAADPADGTYIVVNDADYDVRIPDAHATLRRLDLIVAQVHDAVDDAGTANDWDIVVVQGTPAQVPQMPGLPPASLPLAAVNVVPQAPSFPEKEIVDVREFLVASGGIMPVAGGFFAPPYPAQSVYRLDEKKLYLYDGNRWTTLFDDGYRFPYGTLKYVTSPIEPDFIIRPVDEKDAKAVVSDLSVTFTMPPNVPTTRVVRVTLTGNLRMPTTDARATLRLYLDGVPWLNQPGRRVEVPSDNMAYGFSRVFMFSPPPPAGNHTINVRLWMSEGVFPSPPGNYGGWLTSGELLVELV